MYNLKRRYRPAFMIYLFFLIQVVSSFRQLGPNFTARSIHMPASHATRNGKRAVAFCGSKNDVDKTDLTLAGWSLSVKNMSDS